jgi:bacterial/archaeal transporter family-2 protein
VEKMAYLGAAVALGSGLAIGIQSTLFTLVGRDIGPLRASLLINVLAGLLGGAIVIGWIALRGTSEWQITRPTALLALVAVTIGIGVVTGLAFAFQRMGLGAGTATVFLGQMLVGVIVDILGRSGGEPIPLDPRRVLGLIVMAIAVYLLIPRS